MEVWWCQILGIHIGSGQMCSSLGLSQVREQMKVSWCQILGIHIGSGQMCSSLGLSQVREQMKVSWCQILGIQWMINKCKAKDVNCCPVDSWHAQGALSRWSSTRVFFWIALGNNIAQQLSQQGRMALYSYCCCCWSLLHSILLHSRVDSLRSHVILHEWTAFYSTFLNIHWSVTVLAWLVPHETAAILARSLYTIQHVTACKATYVRCMCVLL